MTSKDMMFIARQMLIAKLRAMVPNHEEIRTYWPMDITDIEVRAIAALFVQGSTNLAEILEMSNKAQTNGR